MPRFFFHLHNGEDCRDTEGVELANIDAAHQEALRSARSIMAGEVIEGRLPLRDVIEVEDEAGATVTRLPFRDAVEIED
jgi:hypothetical protein